MLCSSNLDELNAALEMNDDVISTETVEDTVLIELKEDTSPVQINTYLYEKGIVLSMLTKHKGSLEQEVLRLLREE
ncbi:MAG: hypothetical protein IH946_09665 [Bacteroidetes bacterium]|nr:hypothetical protein [Bacteroidota bacterium]